MNIFFAICMGLAMLLTVATLFAGLFVMARDGENSKERSNKLMRMRVMFQGAAIALFALAMLTGS